MALPHMAAAFNLAYWLVKNRTDADDVVQDAFVRAYRAFGGFEGEDIRPWLLAIVRNVALRWLHDRKRAGNVISFDEALSQRSLEAPGVVQVASDEPSAEAALIAEGERRRVHRALAELAPIYREVVVLREIEQLSYREIALVTGVPMGTVMSRLARGRDDLRAILIRQKAKDEPDAV